MDVETTRALLGEVPAAFHAGIHEILLIAFAVAVAEFAGTPGAPVGIDVEGHGRDEELFAGTDLSRTVGWFTTKYPVAVTVPGLDWARVAAGGAALGAAVKDAKEQLRALPDGLTYGVLRYLNPDAALSQPDPTIGFNYLGRLGAGAQAGGQEWRISPDGGALAGVAMSIPMPLAHTLELNAGTIDTGTDTDPGPRLRAGWTWAPSALDHAQVARLNQLWFDALTGICAHVHTGGGGLTPSDIAPARLTQPQIDELAHRYRVADILPLTPLQHGLLFVTDTARDNPDRVYAVQVEATLTGPIDLPGLRDAVDAAIARHPNLAARFCAQYEHPVQVILADPDVPWSYFEADDRIAQVRATERDAVYDLAEQSPIRVAVIRTAPDQHQLVLTTHHIVLDGWSLPLLLGEVFAAYYAQRLAPPVPYRRFLTWLADRDADAARAAWAEVFAGFDAPTLVAPPNQLAMGPRDVTVVSVPARTTEALGELARAHQTTVSTVLHAAWAQLVMWLTGHRDLAFGAVVSGRPADLPGADAVVGLLINTVPVRATITPSTTAVDLLEQLRAATAQTLEHQHLGLVDIHRATGHRSLFDTVFVYENYPADPAALTGADGLAITSLTTRDYYHYPLTVQAVPGSELGLHLQYRADIFDPAAIAALTERFQQILVGMTADPTRPLRAVEAPARPAIAPPALGRRDSGDSGRAPTTSVERTLTGIYAQVLGVDSVGVDDSFFDLGGDSLSAMRAVAAINAALGTDLAVSALFDAPSVGALGARLGGIG